VVVAEARLSPKCAADYCLRSGQSWLTTNEPSRMRWKIRHRNRFCLIWTGWEGARDGVDVLQEIRAIRDDIGRQ
jgi:hypothetical protein